MFSLVKTVLFRIVLSSLIWIGVSEASSSQDDEFFYDDGNGWQWSVEALQEIEQARSSSSRSGDRIFPPSLYCNLIPDLAAPQLPFGPTGTASASTFYPFPQGILRSPVHEKKRDKSVSFSENNEVYIVKSNYTSKQFYTEEDERRARYLVSLGIDEDEEEDENDFSAQPGQGPLLCQKETPQKSDLHAPKPHNPNHSLHESLSRGGFEDSSLFKK